MYLRSASELSKETMLLSTLFRLVVCIYSQLITFLAVADQAGTGVIILVPSFLIIIVSCIV